MKTHIQPGTWQEWRVKLGASKKDAVDLFREYQDLVKELPADSAVRVLKVLPWQTFEQALSKFLDRMPRKPYAFLARVAAIEARRERQSTAEIRKAMNRRRYQRQYARRAHPASAEPR